MSHDADDANEAKRLRLRVVLGGLAGALLVLPCSIAALTTAWLSTRSSPVEVPASRSSAAAAPSVAADPFIDEARRLAAAMLAAGRGQPAESPFAVRAGASAQGATAALGPSVEWIAVMFGVEGCRTDAGARTLGIQSVVMVFPDGRLRVIDVRGPYPVAFPELTRRRLPAQREPDRNVALGVERMLALLGAHCAVEPLSDAELARLPESMAFRLRDERDLGLGAGVRAAACADVQEAAGPAAYTLRDVQDVVLLLRAGESTAIIGGDFELGAEGLALTPLRSY